MLKSTPSFEEYALLLSDTVKFLRLTHPEKESLMLVIPLPIVTLVRLLQPENAQYPMLVTLSGIVTLVRLLQSENAHSPMLVTLLGIVTLVRLLQYSNA